VTRLAYVAVTAAWLALMAGVLDHEAGWLL